MKKTLLVILSLFLLLQLFGCGKGPGDNDNNVVNDNDNNYVDNNTTKEDDKDYFSTDWKELSFILDGVLYTYPWSFDQLEKQGWVLDGNPNMSIEPQQSNPIWYGEMTNSKYQNYTYVDSDFLRIRVKNNSDEDQALRDCDIVFMNFHILSDWENNKMMNNPFELELANGITWGSTDVDALLAYGTIPVDSIDIGKDYVIMPYAYFEETPEGRIEILMNLVFKDDLGLVSVSLHRYFTSWELLEE